MSKSKKNKNSLQIPFDGGLLVGSNLFKAQYLGIQNYQLFVLIKSHVKYYILFLSE